ncbi:MAG: dTDP-4-dehydrorhamnose 3,5-epimerase family protein [Chloroflexi bacterium]|nr:dTDP-4-dehydrorhamnose 3,5-epimerase family protein [Chloroflexota bacterium]
MTVRTSGRTGIAGVQIKELSQHADERRVFREIIRVTDEFFAEGFAQLSHATILPGVAVAWHVHKTQVDWWYVPLGALKLVLHDLRPDSPTYRQTEEYLLGPDYGHRVVKIPPGVAHGYKAIGGVTHLFYVTSKTYDPKEESRLPHDDPSIGYDWTAGPPIK